ncbi:MAG: PAS domain S-box protein [Defluviicoccus sp.]|nr:MAG: PAS domain S-box protein [Defluviicoccus sp.]
MVISWNPGAEHLFGYTAAEMVGSHISIIAAPGRENEMPMILDRMRRGIPITHYDTVRRRKDGRLIDISLTVSPVRDASGTIIGASKIARDISERKSWEAKQTLLLRELSHRVKNSLAVIQAIARQTGRTSGSVGEFLDRFDDRLSALAAAHDLLVIGGWSGTSLAELGRSALAPRFVRERRTGSPCAL